MGKLIIELLVGSVISTVLLSYVASSLFPITKRTAKILLHILVVILYILFCICGMGEGYNIWQTILAMLIAYIPSYLAGLLVIWLRADVCPKCGAWNSMEYVKTLYKYDSKERVNVERDIRNNEGEKIGSYDSSEIHDVTNRLALERCKECGAEFERGWRTVH